MMKPLQMAHDFLTEVLDEESVTVDATMGNGHDTVFLARLAKTVYAFDIQKQAIEKTRQRLKEADLTNVQLILDGHEHVDSYVKGSISAAIFNLGYLPSADKRVMTQPQTTVIALEKLCRMLKKGGRISVMVYYGHAGGEKEKDAVLDFVSQLPQQEFAVTLYQTLNQVNQPPFLIMIEKQKELYHG